MGCGCGGDVVAGATVEYEYAVKLICGKGKEESLLGEGLFLTLVNIHNPLRHLSGPRATLRWADFVVPHTYPVYVAPRVSPHCCRR
jgi:hypothetical protein